MDMNKNSSVLSVLRNKTNKQRTEWLLHPCSENPTALYGLQFIRNSPPPNVVQLKRFNIFTKAVDVIGIVQLERATLSPNLKRDRFLMSLGSDGKTIGFICYSSVEPLTSGLFCTIATDSGFHKVYLFNDNVRYLPWHSTFDNREQICCSNGKWLLSVCEHEKVFHTKYYDLVLNDETKIVSLQFLTEYIWPDDGWQRLKYDLVFGNKLVVFGHTDGYIRHMNIFDFAVQTWMEIPCSSAPDIERLPPYRIFGTSFDNIRAIDYCGTFILQYDNLSNVWYKTGVTSLFDDPRSNFWSNVWYKTGVTSLFDDPRSNFWLKGCDDVNFGIRSCMISPNLFTAVLRREGCIYHVVLNLFSPLSLKEVCVFKLCKSYSQKHIRKNIVPLLPTLLRRKFFFTA